MGELRRVATATCPCGGSVVSFLLVQHSPSPLSNPTASVCLGAGWQALPVGHTLTPLASAASASEDWNLWKARMAHAVRGGAFAVQLLVFDSSLPVRARCSRAGGAAGERAVPGRVTAAGACNAWTGRMGLHAACITLSWVLCPVVPLQYRLARIPQVGSGNLARTFDLWFSDPWDVLYLHKPQSVSGTAQGGSEFALSLGSQWQ